MPSAFSRVERVGEQIRRELADLIRNAMRDPGIGMASFTEVRVTRDLGHARVFVTVVGDAAQCEQSVAALNRGAGVLRRELGRRLNLRAVPKLRFEYDVSVQRGAAMESLIDAVRQRERGLDDPSA